MRGEEGESAQVGSIDNVDGYPRSSAQLCYSTAVKSMRTRRDEHYIDISSNLWPAECTEILLLETSTGPFHQAVLDRLSKAIVQVGVGGSDKTWSSAYFK